jgi:hypothetical protein
MEHRILPHLVFGREPPRRLHCMFTLDQGSRQRCALPTRLVAGLIVQGQDEEVERQRGW